MGLKAQNKELYATLKDCRNAMNGMARERGRNVALFTQYYKKGKEVVTAALQSARAFMAQPIIGTQGEAA